MIENLINILPRLESLIFENLERTDAQIDTVVGRLDSCNESDVVSELSYEEVVNWFIDQPKHPASKKGAIFRRYCDSDRIAIIQVFLDSSNQIIKKYEGKLYGRKVICASIDDELAETFDNNNVIIVH